MQSPFKLTVLLMTLLQLPVCTLAQQPELASPAASEPTAAAAPAKKTTLEPADFTTRGNGQIELAVGRDSPIFAEFEGSAALTQRLRESLQARGFDLAADATSSKSTLKFRGDITLVGGPKFHKGVKAPIGEATEKALKLAKEKGQVTPANFVQASAGLGLNVAMLQPGLHNFTRGLGISGIAEAIGDATGLRDRLNTTLVGDPRGICLSRCDDWNKVNQTVYLFVAMQSQAAGQKEVRIMSRAFSEVIAPDQVIAYGVDKAIEFIRIVTPEAGNQ
jgi:hypothetical protein